MSRQRRNSPWRIPPFVGAAFVCHLVAFAMLATSGESCMRVPTGDHLRNGLFWAPGSTSERPLEVTMIDPRPPPLMSLPEVDAEREKKIEEARKPEEDPKAEGQVVDSAKPPVEIRPDEARYLSEHDIKVEKQTRGKPGDGQAGARVERRGPAQPPQPPTPERGKKGAPVPGPLTMRAPAPHTLDGSREGLPVAADGTERRRGENPAPAESAEGGGPAAEGSGEDQPAPKVTELRPSDGDITRAVGAGSNDYLPDVDEGEETLLNTKRWRFANFFNRVKRSVAHSWHPEQPYRLRDPTGQIYGLKNRFTVLKVSLHPDGTLRDVLVEKPCGVDFLDDEAISAFREAQPFPNPPLGLVDKGSNLITFRFGFYFEISGSPVFKVYRY
jgi:TonB family protein